MKSTNVLPTPLSYWREPEIVSALLSPSKWQERHLNHENPTTPNPMKLPIRYQQQPVHLYYGKEGLGFRLEGRQYVFIINPKLVWSIFLLLVFLVAQSWWEIGAEPKVVYVAEPASASMFVSDASLANRQSEENNILFAEQPLEEKSLAESASFKESFLVKKQLMVSQYLIEEKVARVDQLSNEALLSLNRKVSELFIETVLPKLDVAPHVYQFFTDSLPLRVLETSLMEQAKFNIPASIKLGQAALETAYGTKVQHNNFFGIKAKAVEGAELTTLEYYTLEELKRNTHKILSKEKITLHGTTMYRCKIKDSFRTYESAWESFRAHSLHLSNQTRYAPLFTKGKDYRAWAEMIGSSKQGGVGYATLPIYGNLLKQVIERYHLYLLDF